MSKALVSAALEQHNAHSPPLTPLAPSQNPVPKPPTTDSGFGEYDHQYFYSRVAENGRLMNVGKVGAAYLLDGVVDINTIAKGTGLESLLGRAGLDWITKVRATSTTCSSKIPHETIKI